MAMLHGRLVIQKRENASILHIILYYMLSPIDMILLSLK